VLVDQRRLVAERLRVGARSNRKARRGEGKSDPSDAHLAVLAALCLDADRLPTTLWVPTTLRTSCDLLIFVDQAAEPVAS
jgi:hypothetical protein